MRLLTTRLALFIVYLRASLYECVCVYARVCVCVCVYPVYLTWPKSNGNVALAAATNSAKHWHMFHINSRVSFVHARCI